MSLLTTITPYWKRPEMLKSWVRAIKRTTTPEIRHLVYFVGESPPEWWDQETSDTHISAMVREEPPGLSIGHYHNLGAQQANTEWIMKLDVDTMPHMLYFLELLPLLRQARPREWFNGGMFYMNKVYSETLLAFRNLPLEADSYQTVMKHARTYSASSYLLPAATNFICRRQDYLDLGGCCENFRGYGWEDYQQIYMLEYHWRQQDPLPGPITMANVTQRCRDEISRRKARELWERSKRWLCLIHHWHAGCPDPLYRGSMEENRKTLFDYVNKKRRRS